MSKKWKDPEEYRQYHREYWRKRKKKILDYLGGKCVECSSIENLEIDHINPATKEFDIKFNLTLNNTKIKTELDKCQLLCAPCHLKKTLQQRPPFEHGTLYGWQKIKCLCEKCQSAKKIWHDRRNEARRLKPGQGVRGPYKPRLVE